MKAAITLLGVLPLFVYSQNTGIGETNPNARLEIKGTNAQPDTNALLVRNGNNDSLFRIGNDGTVGIGSKSRDYGQLSILNNGKLNHHLILRGTNFNGNSGRYFSDLLFTDESESRFWRFSSLVYGPDAADQNSTANGDLVIHNDSIPNVLTLTGSGKIGIRTGSPSGYLQITGDAGDASAPEIIPHINFVGTGLASRVYQYFTSSDGLNKWQIRTQHSPSGPSGSYYVLAYNDQTQFYVYGDGTAGFGNGGSSTALLNLASNSTLTNPTLSLYENEATDFARLQFQNFSGSKFWHIAGFLDNASDANCKMNFYHSVTGDILTIQGDGKVGIGNTSPVLGKLVTRGTVGAVAALFGDNTTGISIENNFPGVGLNTYYNAGRKFISTGYGGLLSLDPNNGNLSLYTTTASGTAGAPATTLQALTITPTGNVGIGTNTPGQKLQVSGNICYTGSIAACSDIRYKKDLQPIDHSLEEVLSLHGIYYYWNTVKFPEMQFNNLRQIGFSAQEVEQKFPELVITNSNGYKSLDYGRLTPVLVEAIKELEKQNRKLENTEAALQKQIDELKNMVDQLVNQKK